MHASVPGLQASITDEIFRALNLPQQGWLRHRLGPLFGPPARRFAEMAAGFEQVAEEQGFPAAARALLPRFVLGLQASGMESIPAEGPLVIASNHPGTVDSVLLAAQANRKDLKIIASGARFLRKMPVAARNLIFVSDETSERFAALRQALRHVRAGGALLLFPSGTIDPDPAIIPGAEKALERWSGSLEILCERIPEVQVVESIVSGVLARHWFNSPLARLYQEGFKRMQVAEFFQVMQMMVFPGTLKLSPRITFGPRLSGAALLQSAEPGGLLTGLVERARELLKFHLDLLHLDRR